MPKARVAKREKVIECAIRLFSEQGYENASLGDVALACGIDKATVNRNFGDKAKLYEAAAERLAQTRLDTAPLDALLAGVDSYDEGLFLLLERYHMVLCESIPLVRFHFMQSPALPIPEMPLFRDMRQYLKNYIAANDVKALEDNLDSSCELLVSFVVKSVWLANLLGGVHEANDSVREEFAKQLQAQIDLCLMTLLAE